LGWFIVNLVPVNTPDNTWFIFLSGLLAISAMLLPGISGSFILLILRKYDTILNAIGHFQFTILIPFALGMITGLVVFSRLIGWLLYTFLSCHFVNHYWHTYWIVVDHLAFSIS